MTLLPTTRLLQSEASLFHKDSFRMTLFDENGYPVFYKCLPIRETTRVVAYAHDKENKPVFLLLFNGKHEYRQNPQGGIDQGEDYKQAGARELQEETGITELEILEDSYMVQEYHSQRKGKLQRSIVHGIAAKVPYQDTIVLNEEDGHTNYGRFTYNEACERLTRFPEQLTLFKGVCGNVGLNQ